MTVNRSQPDTFPCRGDIVVFINLVVVIFAGFHVVYFHFCNGFALVD